MEIKVYVRLGIAFVYLFLAEHNDIIGFCTGNFEPADGIVVLFVILFQGLAVIKRGIVHFRLGLGLGNDRNRLGLRFGLFTGRKAGRHKQNRQNKRNNFFHFITASCI